MDRRLKGLAILFFAAAAVLLMVTLLVGAMHGFEYLYAAVAGISGVLVGSSITLLLRVEEAEELRGHMAALRAFVEAYAERLGLKEVYERRLEELLKEEG